MWYKQLINMLYNKKRGITTKNIFIITLYNKTKNTICLSKKYISPYKFISTSHISNQLKYSSNNKITSPNNKTTLKDKKSDLAYFQ